MWSGWWKRTWTKAEAGDGLGNGRDVDTGLRVSLKSSHAIPFKLRPQTCSNQPS